MRRWIHRVTAKEILTLAREAGKEPRDTFYEYVAAWRYFEAFEHYFGGQYEKADVIAAKVRTDKFIPDPQRLLRARARIAEIGRQEDPFTEIRIAAHQQRMDWEKIKQGNTPIEVLQRIKARHEQYRLCQPELNPEVSSA